MEFISVDCNWPDYAPAYSIFASNNKCICFTLFFSFIFMKNKI